MRREKVSSNHFITPNPLPDEHNTTFLKPTNKWRRKQPLLKIKQTSETPFRQQHFPAEFLTCTSLTIFRLPDADYNTNRESEEEETDPRQKDSYLIGTFACSIDLLPPWPQKSHLHSLSWAACMWKLRPKATDLMSSPWLGRTAASLSDSQMLGWADWAGLTGLTGLGGCSE